MPTTANLFAYATGTGASGNTVGPVDLFFSGFATGAHSAVTLTDVEDAFSETGAAPERCSALPQASWQRHIIFCFNNLTDRFASSSAVSLLGSALAGLVEHSRVFA